MDAEIWLLYHGNATCFIPRGYKGRGYILREGLVSRMQGKGLHEQLGSGISMEGRCDEWSLHLPSWEGLAILYLMSIFQVPCPHYGTPSKVEVFANGAAKY